MIIVKGKGQQLGTSIIESQFNKRYANNAGLKEENVAGVGNTMGTGNNILERRISLCLIVGVHLSRGSLQHLWSEESNYLLKC